MTNEKDKQKQAISQKGTTYTQVNDSTYNWNAPTGHGVIHLDPNSGGPWGTYYVYQGKSAGPDVERKLSRDGLAPHLQNIRTLEFKYPDPWWQPIKEEILIPIKNRIAPKWNGLLDKAKIKKHGGRLTKYQFGGEAPQQAQTEDRQLLALITSAYKEVTSGKLGDSFMYVASMLQDSQEAAKLDSLRTQIPELEEMLSAIEEVAFQQSAYMKKGGCAKKKKVKKGAKGCVPCKKLMKVGGKLINVLTDCEGRIISKHTTGGWLVPKGERGLTAEQMAMLNPAQDLNWAKQQAASTSTHTAKTGKHYYKGDDGIYEVEASGNLDGTYRWGDATKIDPSQYEALKIAQSGENYTINGANIGDFASLGRAYTTQVTPSGPIQYTDGTNWFTSTPQLGADGNYYYGEGVAAKVEDFNVDDFKYGITVDDFKAGRLTREQAAAAGIDVSKFASPSRTVRGMRVEGANSLLGTTGEFTADDYLNRLGAKGVYQNERNLWRKKMREMRSDRAAAYKNVGITRRDDDANNDKTRKSVTTAFEGTKKAYYKNFANQAANNIDAIFNKYKNIPTGSYQPQGNDNDNLDVIGAKQQASPQNPDQLNVVSAKKQGGWLTKFQDGGHMDYETKSNTSGTTWEQRIDRNNTGALYRYNPGRTSHVVTLQTTGLPAINPNRFVKYGEERYYITDPKTGRVMKIEGPTIDQRVEEEAPIVNSSIIEDHITPEQDIFIFPGGFTKVIPTPSQKGAPKQSKKPAKPEKNIEGPKQEIPTQPNDNTSTSGSKTPGNIRQGNYPIYESLPAPDGYDPSNEWVEEKDQVNGQVRVTWRNKKTGEISRIKPFKYGGWLNQF